MTTDEFIRTVDALEDQANTYVTLDDVQSAVGDVDLTRYLEDHILLVDYRVRLDGTPVTLCRLNRRHPLVKQLSGW